MLWGVPTALILAGVSLPASRGVLWIPSFSVMSIACLVNARRCGRLHCHLTGPLFLLVAIASTLDVFAVLRVDWRLALGAVVIGTMMAYGVESVRGKYVKAMVPSARECDASLPRL